MRAVLTVGLLVQVVACGGSVAHTPSAKPAPVKPAESAPAEPVVAAPAPAGAGIVDAQPAAPPADAVSRASLARPTSAPPPVETGMPATVKAKFGGAALQAPPAQVDAGEIPRAALLAVLSQGVGRFLQKVRTEPHLVAGRFVGWRIVSVFQSDAAAGGGVQPGDTVMRVNGQSIERPEQFKNVWDSMATESELLLLVQRAGQPTQVRYRIVDAR